MSNDARATIELEQSNFVKAMLDKKVVPPGFDQKRFSLAKSVLAKKRANSIKKSWPSIAQHLGDDFSCHFQSYVQRVSLPKYQSSLVDGRLFARFLNRRNICSQDVEIAVRRFDHRFYFKGKRILQRNRIEILLYKIGLILGYKPVV